MILTNPAEFYNFRLSKYCVPAPRGHVAGTDGNRLLDGAVYRQETASLASIQILKQRNGDCDWGPASGVVSTENWSAELLSRIS